MKKDLKLIKNFDNIILKQINNLDNFSSIGNFSNIFELQFSKVGWLGKIFYVDSYSIESYLCINKPFIYAGEDISNNKIGTTII